MIPLLTFSWHGILRIIIAAFTAGFVFAHVNKARSEESWGEGKASMSWGKFFIACEGYMSKEECMKYRPCEGNDWSCVVKEVNPEE
jgi:hypothetical protein